MQPWYGATEWRFLARLELDRQQRAMFIMIIAARGQLQQVLEMLLDLPQLGTVIEAAATVAVYCLPRPNQRNLKIEYFKKIYSKL